MSDEQPAAPMLWRRNERWTGAEIEDSFIMVDAESGKYLALNRTAAAVWEALSTPCTQPQLEARLIARFDVSADDCHRAVTTLLEEMGALDLSIAGAS
jgi:hypothetical protein